MLQHMASVSLLGMDTESSWLGDDGSVTVVLSFMVPGVAPSGSGGVAQMAWWMYGAVWMQLLVACSCL
jgi:hypothetical protein